MADFFIDSVGGSATAPYDTWAKAATDLQTALTAGSAGDRFLAENGHNETQGTIKNYIFNGTALNPDILISANATDAGTGWTYAKATTAQFQTTGTGDMDLQASFITFGTYWSIGDDLTITHSPQVAIFNDCTINGANTGSSVQVGNANGTNFVRWFDTEMLMSGSSGILDVASACDFLWLNGPNNNSKYTNAGTKPSILIDDGGRDTKIILEGVDISPITGTIFDLSNAAGINRGEVINCILGVGVALSNTIGRIGTTAKMINSDDTTGNALSRAEYKDYYGSTVIDTANYDNASDGDGTDQFSWKMVTLATNAQEFVEATVSPWIYKRITSTGSKTITAEMISEVTYQDDEVAFELDFMDLSTDTQFKGSWDRVADIKATPANIATSTAVWTSPGVTADIEQKFEVTETVNRIGFIRGRFHLYKASSAAWVSPRLTVS